MMLMFLSTQNAERSKSRVRSDASWIRLRDTAPETDFKEAFRVSREVFWKIVEELEEQLKPQPNFLSPTPPVPVEKQVAMTLYKLGSCCEYRVVGDIFGVHKSTVCVHFHRVVRAINNHYMKEVIYFPGSDECTQIAQEFQNLSGIMQTIGSIDGTHIPITPPDDGRKDFLNRKQWPSVILQAVVDNKNKFRDISIKFPGSCHDAHAFKNSNIFRNNEEMFPRTDYSLNGVHIPYHIIGDPAYPLLPWLLKDFTGRQLSAAEENFNKALNRARVCVEIAFGRLKGRWRILQKRCDISYKVVPQVIAACCILHNMIENDEDSDRDQWNNRNNTEIIYPQPIPQINFQRDSLIGSRIRGSICEFLARRN